MAQFVLKIELLSHIMETAPILEMARAYGLRPRLWLLFQLNGLLCGACYPMHISILRCVFLDIYTFPYTGCGSVINNTLKSPGYPAYSPNDIDCNYTVPIPHNLTMKISFTYFVLEDNPRCG